MLELCEAKIIWSCKAPMVFLFLGLQCSSPLSWLLLFIAMTNQKQGFTFHIHLHFLDHSILSISRERISFSISMHPIPPCLTLILIDTYKFLSAATRELRPKKETLWVTLTSYITCVSKWNNIWWYFINNFAKFNTTLINAEVGPTS